MMRMVYTIIIHAETVDKMNFAEAEIHRAVVAMREKRLADNVQMQAMYVSGKDDINEK